MFQVHQFSRSANDGTNKPARAADLFNAAPQKGIVNVCAIPRNKIVHVINGRQTEMLGVGGCIRRQYPVCQQLFCQFVSKRRLLDDRNSLQFRNPSCSHFRVTPPNFNQHEFRNKQIEVMPSTLPPFFRSGLVSGEPQVPASPGDQVTGNRSFKIKSRFQ